MIKRKPELKLRKMQKVRSKPQRAMQPLSAKESRVRNRYYSTRS